VGLVVLGSLAPRAPNVLPENPPAARGDSSGPVHPGAVLRDILGRENKTEIARRLHISRPTLHALLKERRPLTAGMAIRFAALVGTEADALLRLQADFDAVAEPALSLLTRRAR
jgi:antitoxin HigA-1